VLKRDCAKVRAWSEVIMEEYLDISDRNGMLGYNGVMMCLVFWDKKIIDGVYRKLSSRNILYTQLYLPDQIWSIVLEFSIPPIEQGYECIADEVYFLADTAPHYLLADGFKFDFLDGPRKIGECIVTT
jgi:hypothetical protein